MATLAGNAINTSYQGLLKTTDNAAVGVTAKAVTDGSGNAINLEIGTNDINFTGGTVDFSGATVTNLSGYTPGLVNGTGTESIQSASFLTPTYTTSASGTYAVAIGSNTAAPATSSTAIGSGTNISSASWQGGIAIGMGAAVYGAYGIKIGYRGAFVRAVAIGWDTLAQDRGVAVGNSAACQASGVAIGDNAKANNLQSISIGHDTVSSANNAVAIGNGVTASTADYTTTNNLQLANYASLNYADDTAAAAGGVPLGGIYHTSGALKIRIA